MNIKFKFAITITIISLVVTIPFVLIIIASVNNLLTENADNIIISKNAEIANEINLKIEKSTQIVNTIAHTLLALKKEKKAYPQSITTILESNLINNPSLVGIWSVWEPLSWDTEFGNVQIPIYAPYWKKLKGKMTLDTLKSFNDSILGNYYQEPKKQRRTVIIPPTSYSIDNQKYIISSIVSPIILNNDFKAVVGIDFNYIFFQSVLNKFNLNRASSQVIYNSDGRILAHTDRKKIGDFVKNTETDLFYDSSFFFSQAIKESKTQKKTIFSEKLNQEITLFLTPIKIPKLASTMSIIISIPTKKLYAEIFLFNKKIVLFLIIGSIIFFIITFIYGHLLIKPINLAIEYIVEITKKNKKIEIKPNYKNLADERGVLFKSIENLQKNILYSKQKREKENEIAEWIRNGQSKLYDSMRGLFSVKDMSEKSLSFLCKYLDIQIGALYLHYEKTKYLKLSAAYSLTYDDNVNNFINIGEGLVGQAALDKKITSIENLESEYFYSSSSTLKILPKNIIILPFLLNNKVVGVLELGSYKKIEGKKFQLLESVLENIAIALNSAMITKKILRRRRSKR